MFYKEMSKAMDNKACSHHILMGDFNAKIEVRNINESMDYIGPFGTGNRKRKREKTLVVTNSFFQKAANRHWTWEAPGGV